ncbi:4Fe-4S dicluster domain-containing protein [Pseudoxanthomonas sp. CAU 1598]|uniref:4Fe-4S dicluster domain-containing protein n=1 Tax=Pseudomarimonas arenosa TaxID=2774145 RepID=A0AAW3ZI88_9GAMM|nr:4Fe-4S dicluster domain-containing protein [Pseudomarimonas arenosa]
MKALLDDRRTIALADHCVQCGLCLPHCPTYRAERCESESPRGRVVLIKALANAHEPDLSSVAALSLDRCLGCRQCESACPAGVEYGQLLIAGRARLGGRKRLPLRAQALLWLIEHPFWLHIALRMASHWPGPKSLRARATAPHPGWHASQTPSRGQVVLFTGCLADRLDAAPHAAAVRCLNRRGWNVWVTPPRFCCGSLHDHAGLPGEGAGLRLRLQGELRAAGQFAAVVSCASGCIEALGAAVAPSPVFEVMRFLDQQPPPSSHSAGPGSADLRVLRQIPCTLRAANQADVGSSTLNNAGITWQDMPADCCGAGGWNSWLEPARAQRRFRPLHEWLNQHDARMIISHNIGCRLHLQQQLGRQFHLLHPIELLDRLEQESP